MSLEQLGPQTASIARRFRGAALHGSQSVAMLIKGLHQPPDVDIDLFECLTVLDQDTLAIDPQNAIQAYVDDRMQGVSVAPMIVSCMAAYPTNTMMYHCKVRVQEGPTVDIKFVDRQTFDWWVEGGVMTEGLCICSLKQQMLSLERMAGQDTAWDSMKGAFSLLQIALHSVTDSPNAHAAAMACLRKCSQPCARKALAMAECVAALGGQWKHREEELRRERERLQGEVLHLQETLSREVEAAGRRAESKARDVEQRLNRLGAERDALKRQLEAVRDRLQDAEDTAATDKAALQNSFDELSLETQVLRDEQRGLRTSAAMASVGTRPLTFFMRELLRCNGTPNPDPIPLDTEEGALRLGKPYADYAQAAVQYCVTNDGGCLFVSHDYGFGFALGEVKGGARCAEMQMLAVQRRPLSGKLAVFVGSTMPASCDALATIPSLSLVSMFDTSTYSVKPVQRPKHGMLPSARGVLMALFRATASAETSLKRSEWGEIVQQCTGMPARTPVCGLREILCGRQ